MAIVRRLGKVLATTTLQTSCKATWVRSNSLPQSNRSCCSFAEHKGSCFANLKPTGVRADFVERLAVRPS